MVEIRETTATSILSEPGISALLEEYAAESAIHGLPPPRPHADIYAALDATGALTALGAYLDGVLVGFLLFVTTVSPHYSALLSVCESFFVAAEHRRAGAGLDLLRAAEERARERGAVGLLVSSPIGGRLAEVLPRSGYRETNRAFFRGLA